jgi:hypothetical protein
VKSLLPKENCKNLHWSTRHEYTISTPSLAKADKLEAAIIVATKVRIIKITYTFPFRCIDVAMLWCESVVFQLFGGSAEITTTLLNLPLSIPPAGLLSGHYYPESHSVTGT